jgi:predicted acyltransferase
MSARLVSLDAFRGLTIMGMVLVNNPGDWNNAYAPLLHAPWHGWTITDTIFPFFLFIVGVSMVISTRLQLESGKLNVDVLMKLWMRCGIIALIGFTMNLIPQFDFSTVRVPGVLQRIGLASALAAPIVVFGGARAMVLAMVVLFAAYSALMLGVAVPDANGQMARGALEAGRDFGAYVDRLVFGSHVWRTAKTWDPEGLVSTLPAVGNVFAGALLGLYLRARATAGAAACVWILLAGFAAIFIGGWLDVALMPINKNLWTVSYSVFMSGWALVTFGAVFWLMDVCADTREPARRGLQPFTIVGMNALFIFVLSGIIGRLLVFTKIDGVALKTLVFAPIKALPLAPKASSLLFALLFCAAMFGVAWIMWRKRWFIKV